MTCGVCTAAAGLAAPGGGPQASVHPRAPESER
jgi:hypothetical protein